MSSEQITSNVFLRSEKVHVVDGDDIFVVTAQSRLDTIFNKYFESKLKANIFYSIVKSKIKKRITEDMIMIDVIDTIHDIVYKVIGEY